MSDSGNDSLLLVQALGAMGVLFGRSVVNSSTTALVSVFTHPLVRVSLVQQTDAAPLYYKLHSLAEQVKSLGLVVLCVHNFACTG